MVKRMSRWLGAALVSLCLMLSFAAPALAAEYSCGTYGASTYQNGACGATTQAPSTLENTGQKILPFAIPVVLILAGTLVLYFTRKKSRSTPPSDQLPQ